MADAGRAPGRPSWRSRDDDEGTIDADELGPLLDLAREIKREVDRIAADDAADLDELSDVIDALPRAERRRVALAVFDRLPAEVQWEVLATVFDDAELRDHLSEVQRRRRAQVEQAGAASALVTGARLAGALDTRSLAEGDQLTLDLFREGDVRAAAARGRPSDTAARTLVLRSEGGGQLRVIEDVFNPRGGYFVTREYDATTWEAERFASHDLIRVGALTDGPDGERFEPILYLGGRVDVERGSRYVHGYLHLGMVMLGGIDVFAGTERLPD
jgi:hypothetical protein